MSLDQELEGPGDAVEVIDAAFGGMTVSGLSQLIGVDRGTLQNWGRKPGFPAKNPDGTLNPYLVGLWKGKRDSVRANPIPDDEGLGEGDSPALEVLRTQKAILAGFEVEEKRRNLIPVDVVLDALMDIAAAYRAVHDQVVRLYPDTQPLIEDGRRDAELLINERFGSGTDGTLRVQSGSEDAG